MSRRSMRAKFFCHDFEMKHFGVVILVCLSLLAVADAAPMILVVRHAEKATGGGEDPDLSPAGQKRADALARVLKDSEITAIFVTEFKRTRETAAPIAQAAHIVPTVVAAKDTAGLIARLRTLNGNALVVGHGNTIPNLVKGLGVGMPVNIPEDDYTEIFVVGLGNPPQL